MPSHTRAARAAAEIARINAFFPIMSVLGNRWAATRPFEGHTIGFAAHLTTLTGALLQELQLGGGTWVACGVSEATTDHAVVDLLRAAGIEVYTAGARRDAHLQLLDHNPTLMSDVGGELLVDICKRRPEQAASIRGAVEVTKSGVNRIAQVDLPFGLVNINDGRLKPAVENRHGVGEGLWHATQSLTGMHLAGRRICVIGYGPVGRGVAAYARSAGATVDVIEKDAVRRLCCHYDGFNTPSLDECIDRAGIVVTCTGGTNVLPMTSLKKAKNGLVLLNAGHGGDELDVDGIKAAAIAVDQIADHVIEYKLEDGPTVVLLANGHPLNIVTNSGSPEPVLLHFAVLGLTLEWLTHNHPEPGEMRVPAGIEDEAAALALTALGMAHG